LNILSRVIIVLVTSIVIIIGGFFFIIITLLAAIKNWGAFKNCDSPENDFIDIEDYDY